MSELEQVAKAFEGDHPGVAWAGLVRDATSRILGELGSVVAWKQVSALKAEVAGRLASAEIIVKQLAADLPTLQKASEAADAAHREAFSKYQHTLDRAPERTRAVDDAAYALTVEPKRLATVAAKRVEDAQREKAKADALVVRLGELLAKVERIAEPHAPLLAGLGIGVGAEDGKRKRR